MKKLDMWRSLAKGDFEWADVQKGGTLWERLWKQYSAYFILFLRLLQDFALLKK